MAETGTNPDGSLRIRLDRPSTQAMFLVSGPISSGSPAATGKPGQLNPAFSRWLQAYPEAWDVAAIRASRSHPTTRRKGA